MYSMASGDDLNKLLCPLCGSNGALLVFIERTNGREPYKLPLYQCSGCSVVFTDIERFSTLERNTLTWIGNVAHRQIVATRPRNKESK